MSGLFLSHFYAPIAHVKRPSTFRVGYSHLTLAVGVRLQADCHPNE